MHRYIRLFAIAGALVCLLPTLRSQSPNGALPLPETYFPDLKALLNAAVQQSPRMLSRNAENAIAEANRIVARSGQLPSVGGYASFFPWTRDKRADLPDSTGVKKSAYNFSINQPLYHWGALRDNSKIGELQLKIAQGQTADAYRLLVEEIRAQYLQLIIKKGALARARFNQRLADEQLDLARSKLEKHVIAEADMFGPTIAAEQARIGTDRFEDDYENARGYLGRLCGSAPLTNEQVPDEIPAVTPMSSTIQDLATEFSSHSEFDTYALKILRNQIEVERLNYRIANTRLLPNVNLVAGTSQDEQNYSLNSIRYKVQSYFIGGTLNWSIFDGFATRGVKAASLARRRQLEENYKDQTADLAITVKNQARQLEFTARDLAVMEKLFKSSLDMLHARQEDLKRGVASEADVNAAQLGYYDGELNAFNTRYTYMMKFAEFMSTILKDPALENLPEQKHR